MTTTPSKAAQEAESTGRHAPGAQPLIPPGETALATETITDTTPADPVQRAQPQPQPQPVPQPPPRNAFNTKRDEIAARFRSARVVETDETPESFLQQGLPPELAEAEPEPAQAQPQPAAQPAPAPEPQKIKLKVRHQEIEMPLDEVIAQAQKAIAADNYFDEAKQRLENAKNIEAEFMRNLAALRGGQQPGAHQQPAPPTAQPEPQADPAPAPHQGTDFRKLVEDIQFGNPEEAAQKMEQAFQEIGRVAAPQSAQPQVDMAQLIQQELLNQRIREENARTAKVLQDFRDGNPELASDQFANAAMEAEILRLQTDDLKALGFDTTRLRSDGQPTTATDIANVHRYYRMDKALNLLTPEKMLEHAKDAVLKWRGAKPEPQAEPQRGAPRVEVTVDRTARKEAIPQQPSRTATPQPVQQPGAEPQDRSSVVAAMKRQRAQRRGQVLGV